MNETFFDRIHKNDFLHTPDVLSCLANLSNDEVFTPPEIAKKMVDELPQELFKDPNIKFLDPACKTGVFLREIAKRLIVGLADEIPDLQERLDHIFHKQLYGIAITELTSLLSRRSLYCSKYPNGRYSVSKFNSPEGNIRFRKTKHTWGKTTYDSEGKPHASCIYCGASKEQWDRDISLETHAYEFIHQISIEEAFNMAFFDVIISNPPYQLGDSGYGASASPIYQLFIEQAKKLNPSYISMIVPSRWFAGGRGLDKFREEMLNDDRLEKLVDYEKSSDIFTGVDIAGGVCYFLWNKNHHGDCEVINAYNDKTAISIVRPLNEYPTFVRNNESLDIVKKVLSVHDGDFLCNRISNSKPFGIRTFYKPKSEGIPCWFIQKTGLSYADPNDIQDTNNYLNKWKFLIPAAPIAGQTDFSKPIGFYYDGNTRISSPGECCTESWLVAGAFDTEEEALSYKSYFFTKTVRFLLLQMVVSQHVTRKNFYFVPDLGKYSGEYTDEMLCKKWGITEEEWNLIDSKIHNYGKDE